MPLYEFICPSCDEKFTRLCSLGEDGHNIECPHCNSKPVAKVFSTFATSASGGKISAGASQSSSSCASSGPFR